MFVIQHRDQPHIRLAVRTYNLSQSLSQPRNIDLASTLHIIVKPDTWNRAIRQQIKKVMWQCVFLLICLNPTNAYNITKNNNGVLVSSYIPTFSIKSTFEQINITHIKILEVDIQTLLVKSK